MFDFLSLLAILSAVLVISVNSPVASVLFLIAAFGFSACYLMVLGVGFVGISYLIVYVGAIAVLFLFVVIMLNIRINEITTIGLEYSRGLPLAFIIGTLFILEILSVFPSTSGTWEVLTFAFNAVNLLVLTGTSVPMISEAVGSYGNIPTPDLMLMDTGQVQALGFAFYNYQAIMLMVISLVLLLAMIGAIVLCLRSRSPSTT